MDTRKHSYCQCILKRMDDNNNVRLTVFRNRNTWNTSWKSLVFPEIRIKIVKHLLKCCFKHIFIILAASKRAKHTVLIITPRVFIPELGQSNAPLVKTRNEVQKERKNNPFKLETKGIKTSSRHDSQCDKSRQNL